MTNEKFKSTKTILTIVLIVIAILSISLSSVLSSPKLFKGTYNVLDGQKDIVGSLNIAVTTSATLLSTLPDDTASPIADELADLAMPLFLIVCIIYLEKFLLTTLSWIALLFLIPAACILKVVHNYTNNHRLIILAKKALIMALAFILIIPCSAGIVNKISTTFSESVNHTFDQIFKFSQNTESSEEEGNKIIEFFSGLKDSASAILETAKELLDLLIDAIAVLFIMNFAAPVLTAISFMLIFKYILGLDIHVKDSLMKNWNSRKIMHNNLAHREVEE